MTLIAGIICRKPDLEVPDSVCDALRRLMSCDPADEPTVFHGLRSYFVKVDIGAFGCPAVFEADNGALTLVTGEPLFDLPGATEPQSRERDTRLIHEGLAHNDPDVLRSANGAFSAVHYHPSTGDLVLISDKLGIRPLYYCVGDNYTVVASALRILEDLAEVPKVMDVRTVTENVGLGYPVADRTPYADIKMLRPAETVRFTADAVNHETYWRWDEIAPSTGSEDDLLAKLYDRFETAVSRRIGDDSATTAYLSGGLDSRCIVAELRANNVQVHTFNFARPHTQDLIFGREFAREIEAIHEEVPKPAGDLVPDYSSLMAAALTGTTNRESWPERPGLVWSGEGGSVALGHVHLTQEMVALMRKGEIDQVIDEYIRRESAAVVPSLFQPKVAESLAGVLENGICEELGKLHSQDAARNFYLFLLLNDQHRKLAIHFENIDLHRLEFQLPFFDSALLETIVSIPIDICLRHQLYVKWLDLFPPAVTSVPWQVYPGHQPCPVPITTKFAYQWSGDYQAAELSAKKKRESKEVAKLLRAKDFPKEILSKRNLRLAAWVHATGFRNYQYLLGPARAYHKYFQKCEGKFVLPSSS